MGFAIKSLLGPAMCGLLLGAACRESSAPVTPPLSGSFALSEVNGRTLPDTEAIQISPDPSKPDCAILRKSGMLALDPATGRFSITVNAQSTCTGAQWVLLTEIGTYTQNAQSLAMTEPFLDHVATFTGQIEGQSIIVHGVYYEYTFAR